MICSACNKENRPNARFCTECGHDLSSPPVQEPAQPPLGYSTMRGGPEERSRNRGPRRDDSTGRVLAFLTPFGQFYNGEIWKGIVVSILYLVELALVFSFFGTVVGLIAIIGTWIWAFTDARRVQRGLKEPW